MSGCVAVFDVGKTNIKLVVFDTAAGSSPTGRIPTRRSLPMRDWPYLRLDTERAWRFLLAALKEVGAELPIEAISITTHGASGVLVTDEGVALPPVDYEFDGFAAVDAAYDAVRPPFEECFSTLSAGGLNLGRQIFYLERTFPKEFAARARLPRLSAVLVLAAQRRDGDGGHLAGRPYRSLAPEGRAPVEPRREAGLDAALSADPPRLGDAGALRPGDRGRDRPFARRCASSAARMIRTPRSFPISPRAATRSPCCRPAPGSSSWPSAARRRSIEKADMLANVDVRGRPVPTARLMLGREFAVLAGETPAEAREADVAALVAAGVMAMPAFTDQGGPFAGRRGFVEGEAPTTPAARAALATLYCALMSAHMLKLLEAPGDLIVEGGFNRSPAFAGVLAALMPGRDVLMAPASGAAEGAALLAHWDEKHAPPTLKRARGVERPGLAPLCRSGGEAAL